MYLLRRILKAMEMQEGKGTKDRNLQKKNPYACTNNLFSHNCTLPEGHMLIAPNEYKHPTVISTHYSCQFQKWVDFTVLQNFLLFSFLSITAPQDAHKRLVLQVAEWLTASLSGFKGGARHELMTYLLVQGLKNN